MRSLYELQGQIPAGRIVQRLGGFAVGAWERVREATDDGVETYVERPIEMNANQVRAAIALLNKVMPDLQSMQLDVNDNRAQDVSLDQLRAQLRAIVMPSEAIDVEMVEVKNDLLSLDDPVGESDLLSLD